MTHTILQTTQYESLEAFRAMCVACYGEAPTLTEHSDGTYTDEDGRTVLVPAVINMEIEPGRGMVRLTGPGLVLGLTEYVLGLIDICRLEDDWMPIQGVVRSPLHTDALYERILALVSTLARCRITRRGRASGPRPPRNSWPPSRLSSHDGGAGVIVIDGRRLLRRLTPPNQLRRMK